MDRILNFYAPKAKHIAVCGHFGSGKTNFAVNLALELAEKGERVTLADMDIVNPYFRSADNKELLENAGVKCIIPPFANTNVDIPALPAELYSMFAAQNDSGYYILDIGGDETGAAALGMFSHLMENAGYEMICVASCYRPLTSTAEDTIEVMREIELRSRLHFTSLVNNSSIGDETTLSDFTASFAYAHRLEKLTFLPLICHTTTLEGDFGEEKVAKIDNITVKRY